MEILKLSHMSEFDPNYMLTRGTNFSMNPSKLPTRRNTSGGDTDDKQDIVESGQDRKADLELFASIRETKDVSSLFTPQ